MNALEAQRIRFGILKARSEGEPSRLTPAQADRVQPFNVILTRDKLARRAYEHERTAIINRAIKNYWGKA